MLTIYTDFSRDRGLWSFGDIRERVLCLCVCEGVTLVSESVAFR
jgi:hypothetical protein